MVVVADLAADDLAVEWEGLQHYVESLAVLVGEHQADVQPEIILALAANDRVGAVRRLLRLLSVVRHFQTPFELWRYPAWAGNAGRTAASPASADRLDGGKNWNCSSAYAGRTIGQGHVGHAAQRALGKL